MNTNEWIELALEGPYKKAKAELATNPEIPKSDPYAAIMSGDVEAFQRFLDSDPDIVKRHGGPKNWPPLIYCTFSKFNSDATYKERMHAMTKFLLKHGANPNDTLKEAHEPDFNKSPLYGAVGMFNDPALARILLEAGASPDDEESFYHSTEHRDHECTKLLMEFGVKPNSTNTLLHMLDFDDLEGLKLLLDYGADPNEHNAIDFALLRNRSTAHLKMLNDYGANVQIINDSGKSTYAYATMLGLTEQAEFLASLGVSTELSIVDRFLSAISLGKADEAKALLAEDPKLFDKLSVKEKQSLIEISDRSDLKALTLLLDLGFDIHSKGTIGETLMHFACWTSKPDHVSLLLERGADLSVRDTQYQATPLNWLMQNSMYTPKPAQPGIAQMLIDAGSPLPDHLWGSKEVMEIVGAAMPRD